MLCYNLYAVKREIMKKESIDLYDAHLLSKQRVCFRAFVINLVLVFLVWLLTMCPDFMFLAVKITGISLQYLYISAISFLAIWKLAGIVFFLIPGIAIWWERKMFRR